MQDRQIPSLALDYYRKRGADIRQVEGEQSYEVRPARGTALKVTFAGDTDSGEGSDLPELTANSPQWRAILEDLTAEVAVSYRYLTTGAIPRPLETLGAVMPAGWTLKSVKLLRVESRNALGFSHRVTFDSPALAARRETLHHHLWDAAAAERLTAVEKTFYQLPCIMLRAEHVPTEATIQQLLGRSLGGVDAASEVQGREIEGELGVLLEEAEKRTNQYFEQQMGNVLGREAQVAQKLDAAIRRLTEAKSPEQIARHRQEGEALAQQSDHLRANREAELAAIEVACESKLRAERDKHELTAVTDLVAICHASYDLLTYVTRVADADGFEHTWEVVYWPLSGELRLPPCACCLQPMTAPRALAGDAGFACATCVRACPSCGAAHPTTTSGDVAACGSCGEGVCASCASACTHCGTAACATHAVACIDCQAAVCGPCTTRCAECEGAVCQHHGQADPATGHFYCREHHREVPDGTLKVSTLLALPESLEFPTLPELPALRALTEPITAATIDEVPLLLDPPRARPVRVISRLSGKSLHPLQAETCSACDGHYEVQEMVDCPTCGIPSCLHCVDGQKGGCPACEALAPVSVDDSRLAFVFTTFPELAKRRRRWEAAEIGPYVLTHWSRLGTWGMVVYHRSGDGKEGGRDPLTPVVLTEFAYSRLQSLGQLIGFGRGRAS